MRKPRKTKTGAKKPRASVATIEERIQAVLQLKLDGAEPWHIRAHVSGLEQEGIEPWTMDADQKPLTERTIRRYMAAANQRIAENARTHVTFSIGLHLAQLNGIYARAIQAHDYRAALAALVDKAKMQGLYPAKKKQEVDILARGIGDMTDAEIEAEVGRLDAQRSGAATLVLVHEIVSCDEVASRAGAPESIAG